MGVLAEEAGGGEKGRGSARKEKMEQEQDGKGGPGMHLLTCSTGSRGEKNKMVARMNGLAGKKNREGIHSRSKNRSSQRL